MTRLLLALVLALPMLARGVTLTDTSGFAFCPFPPGLEIDPADDDVALAACSAVPGVFPISIAPGSPMAFAGPNYFLPGSLDVGVGPSARLRRGTQPGRMWMVLPWAGQVARIRVAR